MCELLVEAKVVDDYIDNIIKTINSVNGILEDYSAQNGIENVLTNVKSASGVSSVIKLFCNKKLPYVNSKDDIFAHNCERATELFRQGNVELLTTMTDCFIAMAIKCDRRKCQKAKKFFLDTNTLLTAFEDILNRKLRADNMMFTIENIMDETLEDILTAKYLNSNMIDEAFKWYASRLPSNSAIFIKLDDAVLKKDNAHIQREPQIDWNKNRKEGKQKYFNCLFDQSLFSKLIDELLMYIKKNDITCGQLVSDNSSEIYDFSAVPHEREDLQNIRTALYHCKHPKQKVAQFFDYINWENFCTREMCQMLQNNENDIELDDEQKQYIDDYLKTKLAVINLEDYSESVLDKDENKNEFIRHIMALAINSNFSFTDEKLLEMILLPWYVFVSSTSTGESETLKFVTERIVEPKKLQYKILENIRNRKLAPLAAQTHLLYCLENELPDAIELAIDLFNSGLEEAKYHKNTAVDYLLAMKGDKFVDNLVSKATDYDLLTYLAHCMKSDNTNLINKLIDENKKSESQTLFLKELLELNNRYALETYLELAKRCNGLPDLHSEDSHIGEITMAIRKINDISLIDVISKLFEVCYSEGFTDKESFGLRGALDAVVNNLNQIDEFRIKEMLTDLIEKHSKNRKLLSICHWHLKDVDRLINVSNDLPCGEGETLAFLKSHRTEIWTK